MGRFVGSFFGIFELVLLSTRVLFDLWKVVDAVNIFSCSEVSVTFRVCFSLLIIVVIQTVDRVNILAFISALDFFIMDLFPVSLLLFIFKISVGILLGSRKIIVFLHNRCDLHSVIDAINSTSSVSKVSFTSWFTVVMAMPIISVKLRNRRLFRLPTIHSFLLLGFVLSFNSLFNLNNFICFIFICFGFLFINFLLFNLFLCDFFINHILYLLPRLFFFRRLALLWHRRLNLLFRTLSVLLYWVNLSLLLLDLLFILLNFFFRCLNLLLVDFNLSFVQRNFLITLNFLGLSLSFFVELVLDLLFLRI